MKNDKGFSLIELIIVIAIMAVLVAIIAPNLTKYLGKSKKSADEVNVEEIKKIVDLACALSNTEVTPPDSTKNGQWVVLSQGSAYYDLNAANVGSEMAFAKYVAMQLGDVPISKNNRKPFKVKITGSSGSRYDVEVETQ